MRTETFDFAGAAGQRLSGRLDLPSGPPRAHAVFAHCFTCTKASVAATRISRALASRGFGVLRFDFTGLGQSEGEFADGTFSANVRDLAAAAHALAGRADSPSLLVGHSLGGAAVLAAAGDLPGVAAVATIGAPFSAEHVTRLLGDGVQRLEDEGQAEVDIGGRPFLLRRDFVDDLRAHDPGTRIASLRRALLVLHSPRDRVVDIDNATSIFQAARHPKSFVSLDRADHLLTDRADAEYAAEVIAAWAGRYVASPAPPRAAADTGQVLVEETGEGGYQVEVHAGGARFLADEPPEVGGLGSGPTPYDLLCAALGACTAMTIRMYARRKRMPVTRVRVAVGHARSAERRPADGFVREVVVEGELDADQRERLLEIANRCPVHRTLESGARIATTQAAEVGPLAEVERADAHALDASTLGLRPPDPA